MALPISTATACRLSIGNKVLNEIIINKYNKHKKQYERDQQTIKYFDKLYRKTLRDKVLDKNEFESLCITFTKHVNETNMNLFYKHEQENKTKLF